MRKTKEDKICFLPNPKLKTKELDYLRKDTKDVYTNLFEIKLQKDLRLFQYPLYIFPDVGEGDIRIRNKLFKACGRHLKQIYGECFISGDSLYGMKRIEEKKIIRPKLLLFNVEKKKNEYFLEIQKYVRQKIIKEEDIKNDPLAKQFIELLIRDILHSNPKLEFYKGLFVEKEEKK